MKDRKNRTDKAVSIPAEELQILIREAVADAVAEISKPSKPMFLKEAARHLGLAEGSLYHLSHQKRVPFHKLGRRLIFYADDLNEWIKSGAAGY